MYSKYLVYSTYLWIECKKNMEGKNFGCVDTLLEQSNLYGCIQISLANPLDNENIMISSFYREKNHVFDVYIPCYQVYRNSISRKNNVVPDKPHVVQFILRKEF